MNITIVNYNKESHDADIKFENETNIDIVKGIINQVYNVVN